MKYTIQILACIFCLSSLSSCVSKKKMFSLQTELDVANQQIGECGADLNKYMNLLTECRQQNELLENQISNSEGNLDVRQEQIKDLKAQIRDLKKARDQQAEQVGDLTVLTQSANDNIKETLNQLESKDKYIQYIQAAKSKSDSINLALAVNLKNELADGIEDQDVNIEVDKTVVFINLSDKMLFTSGSTSISPRADEVLSKIAKIVASRPDLEVMVEGYTDNQPINKSCIKDNWDLSVLRSTAVVKKLQTQYNIDPNKLIAAGRGEYNALADNSTIGGRTINRRTRIILLPKIDQFYDLLDPNKVPN